MILFDRTRPTYPYLFFPFSVKIYLPTKLQGNKVEQGEQFGGLTRDLPDFFTVLSDQLYCTQIFLKL